MLTSQPVETCAKGEMTNNQNNLKRDKNLGFSKETRIQGFQKRQEFRVFKRDKNLGFKRDKKNQGFTSDTFPQNDYIEHKNIKEKIAIRLIWLCSLLVEAVVSRTFVLA